MKTFGLCGAALLASLTASCGTVSPQIESRADFLAEATRTYPTQSKERVIQAAELVLRQSDPEDFTFVYDVNGFTGKRRYFVYAIIAAVSGVENWTFQTEQVAAGPIRASLSIADESTTGRGQTNEHQLTSVPLYKLFWSRIDYVLGARSEWPTCAEALADLERARLDARALGGLCGSTSGGKDAAPPTPLAPLAAPEPPARERRRPS